MSFGPRRSLGLLWAALFGVSLLLQSASFATAPPVHAQDEYTLTITTAASSSSVALGGSVHDDATLVGDDGPAAGTITFFVCDPTEVTASGCPSGGTQVGSQVTVSTTDAGGTASSSDYMVGDAADAAGMYCWRAEYTPDPSVEYAADVHTDAMAECFTVAAAPTDPPVDEPDTDIEVVKTPDSGSVGIGGTITWTIDVTNLGDGLATHVVLVDQLPPGAVWTEDIDVCEITGPVGSQVLTCLVGNEPAHHTRTYEVTGIATACGEITNTASATADLEGDDLLGNNSDTGAVTVNCAELAIVKTPDHQAPVQLGSQIGFTVTVTNSGDATAADVHVSDALDSRFSWSIESQSGDLAWTLVGTALSASGDLAPGGSSVHVVATTPLTDTEEHCGLVPNTAFLTQGTGEGATPVGDATAAENVLCAEIGEFHPGGECDANTPYLVYDVPVLNLPAATSVTITFVNPTGPDLVFPNQPLSGRILWPGAVLDADGNIIDWPGWTLLPDGTWVEGDEFSWTRPTVEIRFEVNPEATVTVDYPPASTACADPPPNLGIVKTNDAPVQTIPTTGGPVDLPTAKVGDTVTYTLTYNTNGVAQHHGVITDVLPAGITYVDGSATSSDEFAFVGYTAATRTLRWEAAVVTKAGALDYDVTIDTDAAELPQPLVNVATITTDEQPSDDSSSGVFVGTIPQDLPPTDTLAPSATGGNPGLALLILLVALAIGFVCPVPARVRRRNRLR